MKKFIKSLMLIFVLVLVAGCGAKKNETITTCTLTADDTTNGYKLSSEYKIYANGTDAYKVVSVEKITSEDSEILDSFETYLRETYTESNSNYGGTTNTVTNKNGEVVSTTTIEYNKMDMDKYVEDNSEMKSYVNSNNTFSLKALVEIYESMGATCK